MKSIKIASYNILSGCFENYQQSSKLTNRFELLQRAIKTINADFIGLIDTFKWKEAFSTNVLAEKFGYKHVFHIDMEDTRVAKKIGVAVLTNLNVQKFNVIRAYNRSYIETTMEGLHIYTCYLDDLSENTRLLEIKSLLEQVKYPSVIHGDLNTFNRKYLNQKEDAQDEFTKNNQQMARKLKPILDDMKRGEVIDNLTEHGFKDAQTVFTPTLPSKLFSAAVNEPFVTVDYIFQSGDISAEKSLVYTDPLFDKVSDHYPISAVINY